MDSEPALPCNKNMSLIQIQRECSSRPACLTVWGTGRTVNCLGTFFTSLLRTLRYSTRVHLPEQAETNPHLRLSVKGSVPAMRTRVSALDRC